ncbi:MAG: hypothetical protein HY696_09525 [Deltaproteobacteria bacterium]|nr:hypothetical protein [Deltaproteobacteria bacterium]
MDAFRACVGGFQSSEGPRKVLLAEAGRLQRALRVRDTKTAGAALLQAREALLAVVDPKLLGAYEVLIGVATDNAVEEPVVFALLESASLARFVVPNEESHPAWWAHYEQRLADARQARLDARAEREKLLRRR